MKNITDTNNLKCIAPKLAAEWNYKKNGMQCPEKVFPGSNDKVWWICNRGHEWKASILSRWHGGGCPYCSGSLPIVGETDLQTLNPLLAQQWHPTKNESLTPKDVTLHSAQRVWWICKEGHEWVATIDKRSFGTGCPFCSNRKILVGYNDLETTHPYLAVEWHPTKNGVLTAKNITFGSNKKVWWICKKKHEWQASPNKRSQGRNCPICSGNIIEPGFNDLATLYPEIIVEWDYRKNMLNPTQIAGKTHKKAWWICPAGHSYNSAISERTSQGQGCPICKSELKTSFPEQVLYYYVKKYHEDAISRYQADWLTGSKGRKSEIDVYIPKKCIGIEYDGEAYHKDKDRDLYKDKLAYDHGITLYRIREPECVQLDNTTSIIIYTEPISRRNHYERAIIELFKLLGIDADINIERDSISIMESYEKFICDSSIEKRYPKILEEWDYDKNGLLNPDRINASSDRKVFWKCKWGHSWKAQISSRTIQGTGCPICAGRQVLPGFNDLATTNGELLEEWDYKKNYEINPQNITKGSHKKVWWCCSKCNNSWQTTVKNRVLGYGCPVCARRKISEAASKQNLKKGFNDFATLHPELLVEWDYKRNDINPCEITCGSSKKIWWNCSKCGNGWQTTVYSRSTGSGCPKCFKQNRSVIYRKNAVKKGVNDFESCYPEIAKEWDGSKNDILPSMVSAKSGYKAWWKCSECGESWQSTVRNRADGSGCPVCRKIKYRKSRLGSAVKKGINDLESQYPELAEEWNYSKNLDLFPSGVTVGSGLKVWWKCSQCNWEWETIIGNRTKKGSGCPKCRKI